MSRAVSSALAVSLWILLSVSFAHANSVDLLAFGGLKDGQAVANYYQSAFGVTFSSGFIAYMPASVGGSVNYTPLTINGIANVNPAVFITSATGSINIANGFTTGLNFFYTSPFQKPSPFGVVLTAPAPFSPPSRSPAMTGTALEGAGATGVT